MVNISGFHVDPGFKGKIKFSVYNAGPSPITLDRDQPYFLIWLAQLTSEATKPYSGSYDGQDHIDSGDVNSLKGEIASPNALLKLINENKEHLIKVYLIVAILIPILFAIALNFYLKKNDYEEGYKFRIKEERLSKKIDSLVKVKIDSIERFNKKPIDSLKTHLINKQKK